ncbi:Peroxisome biosynthesis protein pex1 [Bulinus truncatus]|nr:Peroxisome biosynthesis protein pex1 [Bulinus truncatus]
MLRCQLNLKATSSVWLKTGPFEPIIPKKVCIYPVKSTIPAGSSTDSLKATFIHYIKQCADEKHPLVVFQGLFLKFMTFKGQAVEVQLTFFGDNPASVKDVTMLSEANIESVLLTVELDAKVDKLGVITGMSTPSQITSLDPKPLMNKLGFLGGIDNIIEQAITYLHASLGVRPLSQHSFLPHVGLCHGLLLIIGPSGCGKSSLVKAIGAKMSELPVLAYVNYVNCKTLRGNPLAHIKKNLESMFDEAAWYGPSVIILDNLDTIVPAPAGPEAEMSLEMVYASKVSQMLQKMIKYEIENCSRVMVLATSKSRSSLHPSLVSTQGIHYVQKTLDIGSPNKATREEMLQAIIRSHLGLWDKTSQTLDLSLLASKTEGYVARDLESLVNMAIHRKLVKLGDVPKDHLCLSLDDFEDALHTFKPVSVRHIQLHKPGQLGWEDVGGLSRVKTDLIETLKWPSKYPELFNACPLRMRSGILLYGAPGTGKTLLAGVVAKECGLNFLSIKGPELLNKYIGASEQAVRELFTRAQNVKPCVLFFDEFDSIAPKRGHDNTGVTDRVVNQLLTQLDGVEGLQGVYVLAATSRPDLIDPALLRPGRLDRSILCEMPDNEDRFEILKALSKKMSLAWDVDFKEIAAMCEHFTGADLKALLYNAQLKAIHEYTDGHAMKDIRLRGNSELCDSIRKDDSKPKLVFPDSRSGSFSGDSPSYNYTPSTPKSKKNDSPRSRSGTHFSFNDADKFVENSDEQSLKDVLKLRGNCQIRDSPSQNVAKTEVNSSVIDISIFRSRSLSGDSLSHNCSTTTLKSMTNDSPKSNSVKELIFYKSDEPVPDDMNITLRTNADESSTETKNTTTKQVEVTSLASDEITDFEADKPSADNQDNVVKFSVLQEVKEKRKRHYARENKFQPITKDKPSEDSLCLPVENPVTVFTSLERGLATLSPENKARYLSMVKEIQRRDEYLFQAANDKRRTSLQMASRPSALLEINQRHLTESAKSMRPSVSASEREKYTSIYQNFMSSKTKHFEKTQEHQVGLRATLA